MTLSGRGNFTYKFECLVCMNKQLGSLGAPNLQDDNIYVPVGFLGYDIHYVGRKKLENYYRPQIQHYQTYFFCTSPFTLGFGRGYVHSESYLIWV